MLIYYLRLYGYIIYCTDKPDNPIQRILKQNNPTSAISGQAGHN